MDNREVTIHKQDRKEVAFPSQGDWGQIMDIGTKAFKSGLLPTSIKSAEAAQIIALKAWEIGMSPMLAFSHIHIINGKPTLSAELMQTLARKHLPGIRIDILDSSDTLATVRITRPERGSQPHTFTFTIEDAKKAKLLMKDVWQQYPKAMLFSRCMSAALRQMCPDALMGISYTQEELEDAPIEATSKRIDHVQEEKIQNVETKPAPVKETPKPVVHEDAVIIEPIQPPTPAVQAAVDAMEKVIEKDKEKREGVPLSPEGAAILAATLKEMESEVKANAGFQHLSEEQVKAMKNAMITAKLSKQELMSYSHTNFHKPLIAITQEEYKILMMDLESSK